MKHGLSCTLGFIALGVIGLAVGPANADTTAAGPYYATPSWDQTLPVSARFIVLSNMNSDAVLDRETGLVWQKTIDQAFSNEWFAVGHTCASAFIGGRAGWRLPDRHEFASLFFTADPTSAFTLTLPPGHPFVGVVFDQVFWTATSADPAAGFADQAYTFGFRNSSLGGPEIRNDFKVTGRHQVWCVRGGRGEPSE